MSTPIVTVIVPTYNRSGLLKLTIESVLSQTFRDFELLVMDDASTDDTEAMCRAITDPRLKYVRQSKNLGVGGNWSDGLKRSTTKYVCLLMDDDRYGPKFLEHRIPVLEANPTCALVFSPFTQVDFEKHTETHSRTFPLRDGATLDGETFMRTTSVGGTHVGTQIYRREVLIGVLPLCTSFDLIIDSAFIVWMVVQEQIKAVFVEASDSLIAEHPSQVFHRRRREVYAKCDELFLNAMAKSKRRSLGKLLKVLQAELLDQWATYEACKGKPWAACRLWLKAMWVDPWAIRRWRQKLYTLRLILGLAKPHAV